MSGIRPRASAPGVYPRGRRLPYPCLNAPAKPSTGAPTAQLCPHLITTRGTGEGWFGRCGSPGYLAMNMLVEYELTALRDTRHRSTRMVRLR